MSGFKTWYQQHIAWSERTFGPASERGPEGPVDHLRKEVEELAQDPKDLEEVSDCIHLAVDAAWRGGHSYEDLEGAIYQKLLGFHREELTGDLSDLFLVGRLRARVQELSKDPRSLGLIASALVLSAAIACQTGHSLKALLEMLFKKQAKNIARKWPDWRTAPKGKAIEHIKMPKCQMCNDTTYRWGCTSCGWRSGSDDRPKEVTRKLSCESRMKATETLSFCPKCWGDDPAVANHENEVEDSYDCLCVAHQRPNGFQ